jgi:parvulin-like peptidyl-prolyl isomerase
MRLSAASTLILILAISCNKDKPKDGGGGSAGSALAGAGSGSSGSAGGAAPAPSPTDIDSKDILARTQVAREVHVRQVQLAWREREAFYGASQAQLDDRAKTRDQEATAKLAKEILAQLQARPAAIDELIAKHSEDPRSLTGDPFRVEPGGGYPRPLIELALRLQEPEAGIAASDYGYHVVLRVPKPPPDPLESADIMKREEESPPIYWQHIAIGWDQRPANPDPRARARTKAAADELAKALLPKVRAAGDLAKLIKEHSEDPRAKDPARVEMTPGGSAEPAERLAARLKIDEVGIVRSALGWDIVKRVAPPPPPPPDKLESLAILKRKRETIDAKVRHILVGWAEVNGGDARGKARSRAQLEKLVPEILDRARKGESFESLMVAYSEDSPDLVKSARPYAVAPDAPLALPFIDLSLRLKVGELGVVRTEYGLHIIKRIE